MLKGKKVYYKTTPKNTERLFKCNREAALVWNECLRLNQEHHKATGKWLSESELKQLLKGKFTLHSQSIQAIVEKYMDARKSAYNAIQKGISSTKYPYKQKQNFNTKWKKDGFVVHDNGKIELSMGKINGKHQPKIFLHATDLPEGKIKEIELCFQNGMYLSIAYEDGEVAKEYNTQEVAALDPGEIHTVAAFTTSGESLIITGRKVRSIHQLRNKKLAEISRLMSKCKKGSRRWKRLNKAKKYVLSKSARQLKDALHKTTKNFVEWCIENKISDVHMGNPAGVEKNTRKQKIVNKKTAQKLSNWSFGELRKILKYKLNQEGIKLHKADEAYTSQTCPVCLKRKKVSSRNYKCSCGYAEHRDIHGARNILSKALHKEFKHFDVKTCLKYLRIT